jgi:iron complex transport system ATP-binding protein
MIEFKDVSFSHPGGRAPVFEHLSLEMPGGIVSCIGQNGTGKTTFLLLAGGRILPDQGTVLIDGVDTRDFTSEEARAEFASFVYQNMEFENEEPVRDLLGYVFEHGFLKRRDPGLLERLTDVFELGDCLGASIARLSKGQLQRVILAFSLLYGSKHLFMDEPVFALEDTQKKKALSFITDYVRERKIGLFFSLHELDLSRAFSDHLVIFYKNAPPRLGPTEKLFAREIIEEAYGAPIDTLKSRESLFRDVLVRLDQAARDRAR